MLVLKNNRLSLQSQKTIKPKNYKHFDLYKHEKIDLRSATDASLPSIAKHHICMWHDAFARYCGRSTKKRNSTN